MATTTWLEDSKETKKYPPLTEDLEVDVLIIGAGLAGISAAYQLSHSGKSVVVIDKGSIDQTTTAYTTAFLTYYIDNSATELISMFGKAKAKRIWESHNNAIDTIEAIVKKENINCDFIRCDEYVIAHEKKELEDLEEERKSAKDLGFDFSLHEQNTLNFSNAGYMKIPKQAKFHPLKYLIALKDLAQKNGVTFYEKTEVTKISGNEPVIVETKNHRITAQKVLIATYDPFNQPLQLFAHKGMYLSYVLELEIPKNTLKEGLYLDEHNPYHYFRVDPGKTHDRLIVGGEDHRREIPINEMKNYKALEDFVKKLLPDTPYTITKKWKGPILETIDGLAYIGSLTGSPNQFIAIGFSGNGMTYSTITSILFRDFVLGDKNPWFEVYKTSRIPTPKQLYQKTVDYVGEFFGGAVKNMFN
ncbi:hypothetical protein BH11PAT1_BH11PAT1_0940 [soil metagenome]